MTALRRAPRCFALFRIVVAFAIALQTGCGSVAICARAASAPVTESCVADRIHKGEQLSVRTSDGLKHDGHFIRLDTSADSTRLVMSEYEPRSGREPLVVAFNLASIDSVSKNRSVPAPLAKAARAVAITAVVVLAVLVVSFRGASFGD